jgi:outer membrane protein assembly factor BamD (BamD/ComL family)
MANEAANQAAAKEMVIANYYMSKHDYTAAINRLKTIVTQYPGSPLADEAFARLTQTYLALTEVPSMENSRRQFLASEADRRCSFGPPVPSKSFFRRSSQCIKSCWA